MIEILIIIGILAISTLFKPKPIQTTTLGNALMKKLDKPKWESEVQIKRTLTDKEAYTMRKNYPLHSWTQVDTNGLVLLGGGLFPALYYITEYDLEILTKTTNG
jgi:hypothetical protein